MKAWLRRHDFAGFVGFLLILGSALVLLDGVREGWLLP